MILGIDIGSSTTKAVLLDDSLRLLASREALNRGNPAEAFRTVVSGILEGRGRVRLRVGITGAGREIVQAPPEVLLTNEVVALTLAAAHGYPDVRSIIEIGGQTSRWVLLGRASSPSAEPEILDFALNDVCAAGSGAFLEQQAGRLKLAIEEFAGLAAAAGRGATIAGRCSVFAKTDMIHLQQKGTPLEEIAYGLCLALARNFVATVLKGREALPPVLLAGGGARNGGLVNAFREVLGLGQGRLRLADPPHLLAAMGVAVGAAGARRLLDVPDADLLCRFLEPPQSRRRIRSVALGSLEDPPGRGAGPGAGRIRPRPPRRRHRLGQHEPRPGRRGGLRPGRRLPPDQGTPHRGPEGGLPAPRGALSGRLRAPRRRHDRERPPFSGHPPRGGRRP